MASIKNIYAKTRAQDLKQDEADPMRHSENLRHIIKQHENRHKELEGAVKKHMEKNRELEQKLRHHEKKMSDLEKNHAEERDAITDLYHKSRNEARELSRKNREYEDELRSWKSSEDTSKKLDKEVTARKAAESLCSTLSSKLKHHEDMKNKYESLKQSHEKITEKNRDLEKELNSNRALLQREKSKHEKLRESFDETKKSHEQTFSKLASLEKEHNLLTKNSAHNEGVFNDMHKEMKSLKEELHDTTNKAETFSNSLKSVSKILSVYQNIFMQHDPVLAENIAETRKNIMVHLK